MAEPRQYIAVDLGAESGRVMLATIGGVKLELEEIHRFGNGPVEKKGSLHWDFAKLLSETKTGIGKAVQKAQTQIAGIGVDSWAVDFGLLDAEGRLIEPPCHYRDERTKGMKEKAFELAGKRQIYDYTGLQFLPFNTIYQLLAMRSADSDTLAKANKLIFIADLLSYFLCGRAYGEYTIASTSQLMDMRTGEWCRAIFDKLSLPVEIMPPVVAPGTIVGELSAEVAKEIGCDLIPVIAVGSHDTASAVAAVPATESGNWAYLSSGTWSLMGVETAGPVINDKTFKYEFTNEGGVENTIRLLKNIAGLWLIQECRRQWLNEGSELTYAQMTQMAEKAKAFEAYVEPDYEPFLTPGDMPEKINGYLEKNGEKKTNDKGQIVRIILESLAFKYRRVLEKIEDITGDGIDCLHIVGGGIQNELLCQFTANAVGRKVTAGPIEATAIGNVLLQAMATGQIGTLAAGREIVRNSFRLKEYTPVKAKVWQKQYETLNVQ